MRLDSFPLHVAPMIPASRAQDEPSELVGDSDAFHQMLSRLRQVAPTTATVLLLGETGTGKGLAAHEVHRLSPRRNARFVGVDCSSLPATLIESELFGREKGAFTDARSTQIGRFELADGGTIFLDEIGELPLETQAKLLRILQQGEFERLGSPRTMRVDVRVIAATNRNLIDEVRAGPVPSRSVLPPERVSDPHARASRAAERYSHPDGASGHAPGEEASAFRRLRFRRPVLDTLLAYDWPGNIRELENVIERAIISMPGSTLESAGCPYPRGERRVARRSDQSDDRRRTGPHPPDAARQCVAHRRSPRRGAGTRPQSQHASQPHAQARRASGAGARGRRRPVRA